MLFRNRCKFVRNVNKDLQTYNARFFILFIFVKVMTILNLTLMK